MSIKQINELASALEQTYDKITDGDVNFADTLSFKDFPENPIKGIDRNGRIFVLCKVCKEEDFGFGRIFGLAVICNADTWQVRTSEKRQKSPDLFFGFEEEPESITIEKPLEFLQQLFNNTAGCYHLISWNN